MGGTGYAIGLGLASVLCAISLCACSVWGMQEAGTTIKNFNAYTARRTTFNAILLIVVSLWNMLCGALLILAELKLAIFYRYFVSNL